MQGKNIGGSNLGIVTNWKVTLLLKISLQMLIKNKDLIFLLFDLSLLFSFTSLPSWPSLFHPLLLSCQHDEICFIYSKRHQNFKAHSEMDKNCILGSPRIGEAKLRVCSSVDVSCTEFSSSVVLFLFFSSRMLDGSLRETDPWILTLYSTPTTA